MKYSRQSAEEKVTDKDCFSYIKHEILLQRKNNKYIKSSLLNLPGILKINVLKIKTKDNNIGKREN